LRCTYSFSRRRREQRIPKVVGVRMGRRVLTQYPRKLGTLLKRRLQPPRTNAKGKKRRRLFYKKKNLEDDESEDEDEEESTSEDEEDEEDDTD